MVEYNADVLEQLADGLYSQAASIERFAALAAAGALGVSGLLGGMMMDLDGVLIGGLAMVSTFVGGLMGLAWARPRAFALRVQAQTALCQVKIERNTRPRS